MFNEVGLITAFVGGFISFFSPCILPIIPGYLSFVAGSNPEEEGNRFRIIKSTFFFVVGFSMIFTLLGLFLGAISRVFVDFQTWLNWVGGVLIIVFGLFTMKLIDLPFLNREHRIQTDEPRQRGIVSSFVAGAIFAIAWSPCVSAILASILVLAASSGSEGQGALLLLAFSFGLGIPFLLTGAFLEQARKLIRVSAGAMQYVNVIAGILLIALGVLVFTDRLSVLLQIFI